MKNTLSSIFVLVLFALLCSCEQSRVFDKNISLDKAGWYYGIPESFEVSVNDTTIAYNLYINVRHTDAYPYNNLWVNMTTTFPDSSVQTNKVSVDLSESTGQWTGECIDGICFNSVLVQNNFLLPQTGKYTISLEQDMRMNPLPHILSIGIKLEKFGLKSAP